MMRSGFHLKKFLFRVGTQNFSEFRVGTRKNFRIVPSSVLEPGIPGSEMFFRVVPSSGLEIFFRKNENPNCIALIHYLSELILLFTVPSFKLAAPPTLQQNIYLRFK